jgi:hypothetical protein
MQRELVIRAIEGDHDAFSVLVGASLARLYAGAGAFAWSRNATGTIVGGTVVGRRGRLALVSSLQITGARGSRLRPAPTTHR